MKHPTFSGQSDAVCGVCVLVGGWVRVCGVCVLVGGWVRVCVVCVCGACVDVCNANRTH